MGKPILCVGDRAKTPYFFEKKMINVYSVEELCYCLMQDAYLIDQDIMNKELVDWLHTECGLKDLTSTLYTLLNKDGTVSAFVSQILEYVSFYPKEQIEYTVQIIRDNANLSQYEKGKAKADYFLEHKKYQMAIGKYLELLDDIPETEKTVIAAIYYNMGNAYAGLFHFRLAAGAFNRAYKMSGDEECLIHYLLSMRMYMSEEEYLNFVTSNPEVYQVTEKVESMIGKVAGQFETTDEYRMLFTMKVCREEGSDTARNTMPYYQEVEKQTSKLKRSYREMVAK